MLGLCKHNCFHLSPQQPSTVLHTWVSGGGRKGKRSHLLMVNGSTIIASERTNKWLPANICM